MANKTIYKDARQVGFRTEEAIIEIVHKHFPNSTSFYNSAVAEKLDSLGLLPKEYRYLIGA